MKRLHASALALVAVISILPTTVGAQWQWTDRQGKKVFSDQAPPPDVPERNILQRGGRPASHDATDSSVLPAGPGTSAPAARNMVAAPLKPAGVDKELEEKTRRAEADEKARQAAEAEKVVRAKADNCERARQGKATYDSGIRVARLNSQGEREILDDSARAAENRRLQNVIDSECS
ncbi:MAG: DUF4124 domain-containing protein [Janthinobacterium lividum]